MSDYIITEGGELKHYGVVGMKWGIRKGKYDKVSGKADRKLNRLDRKAEKARAKWEKHSGKADKYYGKVTKALKYQKHLVKAKKASLDYANKTRKANDWLKKMEKTFKDTPISMTQNQIDLGKKYMSTIEKRMYDRYYA